MAEKINATCSICGKGYHKCLSCKDKIKVEPWKMYTDTSEHYKISQIVKGFYNGVYSKGEANDRLKNVDLSGLDGFLPHIKKIIEDIIKEDEKIVVEAISENDEIKSVTIEKEEKNNIVNDIKITEENESNEIVEKPIVARKRNYKVEAE